MRARKDISGQETAHQHRISVVTTEHTQLWRLTTSMAMDPSNVSDQNWLGVYILLKICMTTSCNCRSESYLLIRTYQLSMREINMASSRGSPISSTETNPGRFEHGALTSN